MSQGKALMNNNIWKGKIIQTNTTYKIIYRPLAVKRIYLMQFFVQKTTNRSCEGHPRSRINKKRDEVVVDQSKSVFMEYLSSIHKEL